MSTCASGSGYECDFYVGEGYIYTRTLGSEHEVTRCLGGRVHDTEFGNELSYSVNCWIGMG